MASVLALAPLGKVQECNETGPNADDNAGGAVKTNAQEEVARLTKIARAAASDPELDAVEAYACAVEVMYGLSRAAFAMEKAGLARESIVGYLAAARLQLASSKFIERLQRWPRGYPGDFETIEYLVRGPIEPRQDVWAAALEKVALHSAVAQQHRNKIEWQATLIRNAIRSSRRKVRILSLACGGSLDVLRAAQEGMCPNAEFVLNDIDPDAIALSRSRVVQLTARYAEMVGPALSATRALRAEPPFDLILAGGLFDYLGERQARVLLRSMLSLLAPTGACFLTNIAPDNPFRPWMEYCVDWRLIERSETDLQSLVPSPTPTEFVTTTARDLTGLAYGVTIRQVSREDNDGALQSCAASSTEQ